MPQQEINSDDVVELYNKFMDATSERLQALVKTNHLNKDVSAKLLSDLCLGMWDKAIQFEITGKSTIAQIEISEEQKDLNKAQAELARAQADLVREQTNTAVQDTALRSQQVLNAAEEQSVIENNAANLATENSVISNNADSVAKDVELKTQQIVNLGKEEDLIENNAAKVAQDTLLSQQQTTNAAAENTVIQNTASKIVSDTALVDQQASNALTENTVIQNTADKVEAEVGLIGARESAEKSKYLDTVPTGSGTTATVSGLIGKQKELYEAQKNGFSHNHKEKVLKTVLDTINVRKSQDEVIDYNQIGLDNSSIEELVNDATSSAKN